MTSRSGSDPGGLVDSGLLARVGHLPLLARTPVAGSVSGRHRSPHRGSSVEFAEVRDYVPGDDLRRLDWRAYGRSDRDFVKEFEADTNLRLVLVLDASGSMRFAGDGAGRATKFEVAARAAAVLAYIALRQGDAAGLWTASDASPVDVPPRRKPSHLRVLSDVLQRAEPAGPTRLAETLHEVAERVERRALVCVFSDLFSDPGELRSAFQHLRHRRHDVAIFQLLAREEVEFAFDRPTRFVDLEGGAPVLADPSMVARRYQDAFAAHRAAIDDLVRSADLDHREVLANEDPATWLSDFLLGRARKGVRG